MKKICLTGVVMAAYSIGWAASPGEGLVKSCLLAQSVSQSVAIEGIHTHEVSQEATTQPALTQAFSSNMNVPTSATRKGSRRRR